jgi:hypothetical protein
LRIKQQADRVVNQSGPTPRAGNRRYAHGPFLPLRKPRCWSYNCGTANRRVDVTEFIAWARACGVEPAEAFKRFLALR